MKLRESTEDKKTRNRGVTKSDCLLGFSKGKGSLKRPSWLASEEEDGEEEVEEEEEEEEVELSLPLE